MRFLPLALLLGLAAAGCAPQPAIAPAPAGDVRLGGISLLGTWDAIGAPDQPDVDRDLRNGMLTRVLVINPRGRVTLSGVDRRAGTGHVTFQGRIDGERLTFAELPGTATVSVRNPSMIEVRDPRGNRTVYRRRS